MCSISSLLFSKEILQMLQIRPPSLCFAYTFFINYSLLRYELIVTGFIYYWKIYLNLFAALPVYYASNFLFIFFWSDIISVLRLCYLLTFEDSPLLCSCLVFCKVVTMTIWVHPSFRMISMEKVKCLIFW